MRVLAYMLGGSGTVLSSVLMLYSVFGEFPPPTGGGPPFSIAVMLLGGAVLMFSYMGAYHIICADSKKS